MAPPGTLGGAGSQEYFQFGLREYDRAHVAAIRDQPRRLLEIPLALQQRGAHRGLRGGLGCGLPGFLGADVVRDVLAAAPHVRVAVDAVLEADIGLARQPGHRLAVRQVDAQPQRGDTDATVQRARIEDNLEQEAGRLVAHGDYLQQRIAAARQLNRYVTSEDLQSYVSDFIDEYCQGAQLVRVREGEPSLWEIDLGPTVRADFADFLEKERKKLEDEKKQSKKFPERPPLLVTSGGQGPDEPVAEARAMAEYLTDDGFPADGLTPEDLLLDADIAMYAAKEQGRNRYVVFHGDLDRGVRDEPGVGFAGHVHG